MVQGENLLLAARGLVEVCRGRRDAAGTITKFVVLVLGHATRFGQVEDELLAAVGGGLGASLAGLLGRRHVLLGDRLGAERHCLLRASLVSGFVQSPVCRKYKVRIAMVCGSIVLV